MRKLAIILALITVPAFAQIPQPQINLTGNIGCQGFPCLNSGTLIFSSDADRAMTAQETSATGGIKVTSSVSLTATRDLILPAGNFQFIAIENDTTGGQAIRIIGPTGTGITIPNGSTATIWFDGTNVTGSSGTPGGPTGALQYNDNGALGGIVGATGTPLGYSFDIFAEGDSITNSFTLAQYENDFVFRLARAVNAARVMITGQVGGQLAGAWGGIYQYLPQTQPVPATLISFELGVNDAIQAGFWIGYQTTAYTSDGTSVTFAATNKFSAGQQTVFFVTTPTDALSALNGNVYPVTAASPTSFTIATTAIASGSGSTALKASSYNQVVDFQMDVAAATVYNEYQGSPYYAQLFNYAPAAGLTLTTTGTYTHSTVPSGGYSQAPGEICTSASCTVRADFTGSALYVATGISNTYSSGITSSVVCDGVSQSPPLYFTFYNGENGRNVSQLGFTRFPLSAGNHSCVVTVSTGGDLQFFAVAPPAPYKGRVILVNGIMPFVNTYTNVSTPYPAPLYRTAASDAVDMIVGDNGVNVAYVDQATAFPAIPSNFGDGSLHPSDAAHDLLAQNAFNALKTLLGVTTYWAYPAYVTGAFGIPGPPPQGENYNFMGNSLRALTLDTNNAGSLFNTGCPYALGGLIVGDYNTACGSQALNSLTGYLGSTTGVKTITLGSGGSGYVVGNTITLAQAGATQQAQLFITGTSAGAVTTFNIIPGLNGTGHSIASGVASTGGGGSGATFNITAIGAPPIHAAQNTALGVGTLASITTSGLNTAVGPNAFGNLLGGSGGFTGLGTNACQLYKPKSGSIVEMGGTCIGYSAGINPLGQFSLGFNYSATNGQTDNNFVAVGEFSGKNSPYVLTNDITSVGTKATVMGDYSAEIGMGSNPYTHTFAFRGNSIADDAGNLNAKFVNSAVTSLTSGTTIAPLSGLVSVAGSAAISTITVPTVPWGTAAVSDTLGSTWVSTGSVLTMTGPQPWPFAVGQPIEWFGSPADSLYALSNIPLTVASVSGTVFAVNTTAIASGSGSTGGGWVTSSLTGPFQGCIDLMNTGTWTMVTGGNIAVAASPSAGSTVHVCYNPTTSMWYPQL